MENLENNKMIATFMGGEDQSRFVGGGECFFFDEKKYAGGATVKIFPYKDLKYHSDWSWIMPVIEKIDRTDTLSSIEEPYWYCVSLHGSDARVVDGKTGETIIEIKEEDEYTWIGTAYKLAVEFVKWYNANKK